jgi:hypothetical protein
MRVAEAEKRAGEALRELTEVAGLSLGETVEWCGETLTVREATRLRRLATLDQDDTVPCRQRQRQRQRRVGERVPVRRLAQAVGRSYVLSSGVGEAVERGGWPGGGLDAAVEPSGEGALEAAADVSMRLALGEAFGFVGAGFVVAAQSGNRHCVESPIEVPVAGAAQSVSGPLAAAGLERGDTSQ